MMQYTKEQALRIVFRAATEFDQLLANKNILFILTDKHKNISAFETTFRPYHFKHLTGLDPNDRLTATDFYDKCIKRRLRTDDIEFSKNGTTQMKLAVLPYVISKSLGAKMVGPFTGSKFDLYTDKLAGNVSACIGFVASKNDGYVPNTLLNVDIRQACNEPLRVIAAYRKNCCAAEYHDLVYKAKKITWSDIRYPDEYLYIEKPCG